MWKIYQPWFLPMGLPMDIMHRWACHVSYTSTPMEILPFSNHGFGIAPGASATMSLDKWNFHACKRFSIFFAWMHAFAHAWGSCHLNSMVPHACFMYPFMAKDSWAVLTWFLCFVILLSFFKRHTCTCAMQPKKQHRALEETHCTCMCLATASANI